EVTMKRRDFLRAGAAGAAGLWLGGCEGSAAGRRADGGSSSDAAHPGDAGACAVTESNIEGPFYLPGAPSRMVLISEDTPGVRLHLSGRIVGDGDCAPIPGAVLDVWQADA